MINRIYATVGMTILATALVSSTAMAAQLSAKVTSHSCNDSVYSGKQTMLVSSVPVRPNSNRPITAPSGGGTEKKDCVTTNAPATNSQGENGTNRCTTCTYSTNGHVTVNCLFIKTKN
ncbi:hypothetical protein CAL7716_039680 [Calothrix sp. PCC 7716]|nr:hypothetical protein CAL7716_039680 [Calothrix sp. PCC 7716]